MPAPGVFILLQFICEHIRDFDSQRINAVNIVPEFGNTVQNELPQRFLSLEVVLQDLNQLGQRQLLIPVNQLPDCLQRICHRCSADGNQSSCIIVCAAVRTITAIGNAVVQKQADKWERKEFLVYPICDVCFFNLQGDSLAEITMETVHQLIKRLRFFAVWLEHGNAGFQISPISQCQFQNLCHVDIAAIAPCPMTVHGNFITANSNVVPCLPNRNTMLNQTWNDTVIIQ